LRALRGGEDGADKRAPLVSERNASSAAARAEREERAEWACAGEWAATRSRSGWSGPVACGEAGPGREGSGQRWLTGPRGREGEDGPGWAVAGFWAWV